MVIKGFYDPKTTAEVEEEPMLPSVRLKLWRIHMHRKNWFTTAIWKFFNALTHD